VVVIFWKTASTFDSSAQIGLVLLFGVVVNNAILLVSRFRTEAFLILKAKLGGDPAAQAALFSGGRKTLGGGALWYLPKQERGPLLRRAVARGTQVRLRSILLTSGTTIVSLVPLLVQVERAPWKPGWLFGLELPWTLSWLEGGNQDIWQNLALTSIGGLISSTVLIVVAIPPLYYLSTRSGWAVRRVAGWIAAAARWIGSKLFRRPSRASA
jgi:HAE1 family hydrophobic/amphiphilic exporter-1